MWQSPLRYVSYYCSPGQRCLLTRSSLPDRKKQSESSDATNPSVEIVDSATCLSSSRFRNTLAFTQKERRMARVSSLVARQPEATNTACKKTRIRRTGSVAAARREKLVTTRELLNPGGERSTIQTVQNDGLTESYGWLIRRSRRLGQQ